MWLIAIRTQKMDSLTLKTSRKSLNNRPNLTFSVSRGLETLLVIGLVAQKAPLVFATLWLSVFSSIILKPQRGLFHRFLKQGVNLSCFFHQSIQIHNFQQTKPHILHLTTFNSFGFPTTVVKMNSKRQNCVGTPSGS